MATDKSLPMNVRTTALTLVAATGKGDPRAFPLIFDEFKKAYAANNFNGLFSTTQAIIKIADPRGQEAIDMLRDKIQGNQGMMKFVDTPRPV